MPMNSVLVIGSGFLGGHIIRQLCERENLRIAAFDLFENEKLLHELHGQFTMYTGDLTKQGDIERVFEEFHPRVVIHTASPVHNLARDIYFEVNVDGTANIIKACQKFNVDALVYTSSAGVVFNGADLINVDESQPIPEVHMDAYNESKALAEKQVLEASSESLKTAALRVAGLFGPGDRQLVPGMLSVLKNGQTKFQLGDNLNLFDFTYIENAAYAHLLAMDNLLSSNPTANGQVFFITNGQVIYFWDFARAIWAHAGHVPPYIIKFPRPVGMLLATAAEWVCYFLKKEPGFTRFRVQFSCANRYFNIQKAEDVLKYHPIVDLEEGIRRTLAWMDTEKKH
ncbi:3 beta-hydroxysteroid dehydrogenase/delta 5--_4-isomerase Erg26 [Schizosaccharomyces pombe]|uniref:Sterol-4-alpha-carboxylate 3-dehydrogenase erg26, decarboxylating n=1 Tax=Schizosaccharomyces pombe (strain 972 / ATCC 24843) TaxID=284812 RepID=ERG26_SCHPO|nr:putative 3 beta-hydroxysteroid dehydrogenase/delta 5-to-4-isomerase [Schizosaccharomyces pombe]O43050.1 RecName: Full=Sterol-4-alpha-carboxylate 3-dehydrogenase erg26, decarboxylating; AltName: Full=C-3 sterol dehydrogenase erg26; AltName: Full=C-4 decarboxylase erg26; AltName: Full=Ergosterol biosynthetic protein 26 [Schizosaccharomyces pombe 972h-]CAA17691.1 3 beta-hydroxysteroid dehydrogenase/delta 5-->4-isomerase (predicted) [Schizosaccharomyces pombe]|eukprot:NP_596741.1 putative 3 beta-hydroxysteroid dehydrogenase/delta 5-to-4-isomerase [Schizosaccharomyces pombe]